MTDQQINARAEADIRKRIGELQELLSAAEGEACQAEARLLKGCIRELQGDLLDLVIAEVG